MGLVGLALRMHTGPLRYRGPFTAEAPGPQTTHGGRGWPFSSPTERAGRHPSSNTVVVTTCSRKGPARQRGCVLVTSGCEGGLRVGTSGACLRRGFRLHQMACFRKPECVVRGPVPSQPQLSLLSGRGAQAAQEEGTLQACSLFSPPRSLSSLTGS